VLNLNEVVSVDITLQIGAASEVVESLARLPSWIRPRPIGRGRQRAFLDAVALTRAMFSNCCNCSQVCSRRSETISFMARTNPASSPSTWPGPLEQLLRNGGDSNDLFANLPAVQPSPDSIEEFRVITNTFDAEYGRNSGAVVNVVTKSGSNDFHGSVYESPQRRPHAHGFTFQPTPKALQANSLRNARRPDQERQVFLFWFL